MRNLVDQDLFEVLQIGFREDSYTELIANVFENDEETALEFLRQSFPDAPPTAGPVSAETRVQARTASGGKIIPDLLVRCGDEAQTELYVIEAKIEAAEGDRQTKRYLEAQEALLGRYPGSAARSIGFLTLDGRAPSCDGVKLLTYELLVDLLRPERFADHPWMQVAVETLKDRLAEYYTAMHAIMDDDKDTNQYGQQRLADFLEGARGLVTERDLFYWLTRRVGGGLDLEMEAGIAQGVGTAYPLQTFYLPTWRRGPLPESLGDSFYIHLEAQLKTGEVVLMLHYETCPYRSSLGRCAERDEYARYWEKRTKFARALEEEMAGDPVVGRWKRNRVQEDLPTGKNHNQLAILMNPFATHRTVAEFETWLDSAVAGMTKVVERARSRASDSHLLAP